VKRAADFDRTRDDPDKALKAAGRTFPEFVATVAAGVTALQKRSSQ
jgi:hypothetical protein